MGSPSDTLQNPAPPLPNFVKRCFLSPAPAKLSLLKMKCSAQIIKLRYIHPFGIARWTKTETASLIVRLEKDGIVAYGEGTPNARYGESAEEGLAYLQKILPTLPSAEIEEVMPLLYKSDGNWSAKAAIDGALHDFWAKKEGKPLYQLLWNTTAQTKPLTSFTIGIDTPEIMQQKVREAEPYQLLKVKVGTKNDVEIIKAIRSVTHKTIRVDANEGWKSEGEVLDNLEWLADKGVELCEQPVAAGNFELMKRIKPQSPMPLIADEDCSQVASIEKLADAYHGINIKLDKSGGIWMGMKMYQRAKALGLKVMVGCMAQSALAIAAAAHLAQNSEYVDLDGHLLLKDQPFTGLGVIDGRLVLHEIAGVGVSLVQ